MMNYDVVIVGGGPGGYVAAIRSAQLGHKTLIIEKEKLGGICLNWGCIPTKSLLKSATVYDTVLNSSKYGIEAKSVAFDWRKIIARSRNTAKRLSKGIEYLMKKNKIDIISGEAVIESKNTIVVDGDKKIECKNIVIATGCRPKEFPGTKFDEEKIINYKNAMTLNKIPEKIAIVGAGAIGVEFGYFFNSFGSEVTIIEALDRLLPSEDIDISKELEKSFKKNKIKTIFSNKIKEIKADSNVKISLSNDIINVDAVLIAIGVKGNYESILGNIDIEIDKSFIVTNKFMQTSYDNIYAIGDIAGPPWLAHVASSEGILAIEHLSGLNPIPINYENIPGCTYCKPEISSIGLTEEQAINKGYKIKIGKFPLSASGKAMAVSSTEGFAKIIFDEKYGELLGFHMIGESATELVSEIAVAKSLEATYEEILKIIHPHPTISEVIPEATGVAIDESIHI